MYFQDYGSEKLKKKKNSYYEEIYLNSQEQMTLRRRVCLDELVSYMGYWQHKKVESNQQMMDVR